MPPRKRKSAPAPAHPASAHLSPAQREALTSGGQQPGRAPFPALDEPDSFTASIAEGLRDLGLARLRGGDEPGALRLLQSAETLRGSAGWEVSETDERLAELRAFAVAFSGELTEADDLAEDIEHASVPDDLTAVTDPTDLCDVIESLHAEVRALRKIEKTYAEFRRTLGELSDKHNIGDEL